MPAYNYKARFAPDVESGKKRTTLRKPRKYPTKPGDWLKHYTGMRTRACRLLSEGECLSVEPVKIDHAFVYLNGESLPYAEIIKLAHADGFASVEEFASFFDGQYGLPVELELIKW